MTQVPHFAPAASLGIECGAPVSAETWTGLAHGCNWVSGRGCQLIPWTAVCATILSGNSATLRFKTIGKAAVVAHQWGIVMRAATAGASATVTINGTAYDPRFPPTTASEQRNSETFVETLSSKSSASSSADHTVTIAAAGGNIIVDSIACLALPRKVLDQDTTDYGVDVNTLRARQPILDATYASLAGVCDAEKNLNGARRGHFYWSVPTGDAISPGSTSLTALFEDPQVVQSAMLDGATTEPLRCYVYAKVTGGTGTVKFSSAQAADATSLSITTTSFAWSSAGLLEVETEDLTAANGYRSGREEITIEASNPAAQTLSVAAIAIVRDGSADYT